MTGADDRGIIPVLGRKMTRELLQIVAIRIVIEVKTQGEILPPKLPGKRGKWIGPGNATPGRAIERYVARRTYQVHASNLPLFRDREFDAHFALLHDGRTRHFGNQVVPVLFNVL